MKPENFIKFMKDSGLTEKEIEQVQTFLCNPGSGLTTAEIKLKCLELAVDKSDPAFNSDKTFALAGRFAEFVLGETSKADDEPPKNTDWYESLLCTTGKEGTVYRKRTSFESARTILPILNRGELAPAWIETYYRRSSQSGRV